MTFRENSSYDHIQVILFMMNRDLPLLAKKTLWSQLGRSLGCVVKNEMQYFNQAVMLKMRDLRRKALGCQLDWENQRDKGRYGSGCHLKVSWGRVLGSHLDFLGFLILEYGYNFSMSCKE
jgi:hypothetical protein